MQTVETRVENVLMGCRLHVKHADASGVYGSVVLLASHPYLRTWHMLVILQSDIRIRFKIS